MQVALSGKGPKCRVCTHPDRMEIESLLARGATIASIAPTMGKAFSRRTLCRHRAQHMIYAGTLAALPIPFPYSGSILQRLEWLQRELEHTAALAEHQGDLGTKVKALYALGRMLWLENRLSGGAKDVTPEEQDEQSLAEYEEFQKQRLEDSRARREAALKDSGTHFLEGESVVGTVPSQAEDGFNARY
jgi:hypothetical protein